MPFWLNFLGSVGVYIMLIFKLLLLCLLVKRREKKLFGLFPDTFLNLLQRRG